MTEGTDVCFKLELPPEMTLAESRVSFPGVGLHGGNEPLGSWFIGQQREVNRMTRSSEAKTIIQHVGI